MIGSSWASGSWTDETWADAWASEPAGDGTSQPGVGSLLVTGFAPTSIGDAPAVEEDVGGVWLGDNRRQKLPPGRRFYRGFAPTVTVGPAVARPKRGELRVIGFAPTAVISAPVVPDQPPIAPPAPIVVAPPVASPVPPAVVAPEPEIPAVQPPTVVQLGKPRRITLVGFAPTVTVSAVRSSAAKSPITDDDMFPILLAIQLFEDAA